MPKSLYTLKHEQLLRDLKNIIDGLLSTQVANVWSIYGGLNRLHNLMDKIFKHGCKLKDDVNGSYFNFLEGLEWLQPHTSTCYFSIDCEYQTHMPSHLQGNKAAIWLYKNLENLSLSTKLGWLLSDKNHLNACYYSHAFLCDEEYSEAVLICLKALERNQPTLMAEINPCLFLLQPNARDFHKLHRRCSSFPDNYLGKMESKSIRRIKKLDERHSICDIMGQSRKSKNSGIVFKLKPWSSTPNLFLDKMDIVKKIVQSKTVPNTPIHKKGSCKVVKKTTRNCTFFQNNKEAVDNPTPVVNQNILNKIKPIVIDNKNIVEYTPSTSYSSETTLGEKLDALEQKSSISVIDYSFRALPGEKDYKKIPQRSFIEGGGKSILPMSTGYIPTPVEGQSLLSFLTSSQLTRPNAELDRENAHFNVSEAIISAIEQMKCKKELRLSDDPTDESDPEILELKQRIRIRRRQKMVEKQRRLWASSILSDGITETTSASPPSTSSNSYSESSSSENIDDIEIDEASNLAETKGLSNSMASLYSEADLKRTRGIPDGASDILSAESVAISLISTFKGKRLPKASELQWLVSEKDAPQALLPLPKSWPVNPDDHLTSISLRGTEEWAPPRPQIIFTLHPSSSSRFFRRKELMIKQNYRCAGCGMRVAPQYASKFRYCEYLGRYFCTGCHTNQLALIPARILHKWDFSRLPVSTFSYRLLEQMYTDPLFRIFDLNKNITKFSKDIEFHRKYALGLFYIKDFILTCDNTESIRKTLKPYLKNSKDELEMYSLEDLVKIKSGQMKLELKNVVDLSIKHITDCQICMGRGHICEMCKSNAVIFPWQLSFVSRCDNCGCCYHKSCWKVGSPCRKCIRLSRRRESYNSN